MSLAMFQSFFSVFANRTYRKLFLANFTSEFGSTIGTVAFAFYLLDRFSSQPGYATMAELMISLPTLCVFWIVGVLADRMNRQKIAANADWIRAGLTLLILAALWAGWVPVIFALLFVRSAVGRFFLPAEAALVQGVLDQEEYTTAVGLNQMVSSVFLLFGSGLGALCYWNLGAEGAMAVDAASFFLSGWLIRACRISREVLLPNGATSWRELKPSVVFLDLKAGAQYVLSYPLLRSLLFGLLILGVVNGGLTVLPMFLLKYKLAPDSYQAMTVYQGIVFGAALLIGSPVASLLAKKIPLYRLIIFGFLLGAVGIGCTGFAGSMPVYYACFALFALSIPLVNIPFNGWMQQIVDPKMMGRVQGWITPLTQSSQSLALALLAWLFPAHFTLPTLFLCVGSLVLLTALFYTYALPRYAEEKNPPSAA
ncbi:MFS transporter [Tumebacillus flagellatus]|uniref:MFS transporter n=1 Tax=Tumebacillus flagellatus TaxID=1157490 RepID=A0A074LTB9_9BACL|nr:MFS transporter [Tumebacillus flagellatus]KEO84279.1 MFS transporter [Tumebacillus flagellatus]